MRVTQAKSKLFWFFQGELKICRSSEFTVHITVAVKQTEITAHANELRLRDQLVAGNDLALEFHMLHTAEQGNLAAMLLRVKHGNAADLCHGLEDQHARMIG